MRYLKKLYHIASQNKTKMEAAPRIGLGNRGFADLGLTTWLSRLIGAENGTRTRDPHLGKVVLYQLSYFRKMATRMGLEPMTSAVTGRHSNQLNYRAVKTLLIIQI